MGKLYICHNCKATYDLMEGDRFCSMCGSNIAELYSDMYLKTKGEINKLKNKRHALQKVLDNAKKELNNNYNTYISLENKINDFKKNIKTFCKNNKTTHETFYPLITNYMMTEIKLNKYKDVLDEKYFDIKELFKGSSKKAKQTYMEYIMLGYDQLDKYEGIKDFKKVNIVLSDPYKNIWENSLKKLKSELFFNHSKDKIYGYPGNSIAEKNYSDINADIFEDFFSKRIKYVSSEEMENIKHPFDVEPVQFVMVDDNLVLSKKGTLTYFVEGQLKTVDDDN